MPPSCIQQPLAKLAQTIAIMARNKSKIETIVIALILIIGLTGAFFLFSGNEGATASPGHSLENPSAVYQVSMAEQP
jgi:hypothetical protein